MPVAVVATRLADALAQGDLIYVAADELRAELVAAALRIAAPSAEIAHLPSSDALPGDPHPASAANAGKRVAALHCLRRLQQEKDRPAIALVTTAEAAARLYPSPDAFAPAPPRIAPGDSAERLEQTLSELGYRPDERVDEPGEMAVRGQVIDLFPADVALPIRIAVEEGRITAIRAYDPATQLGTAELPDLEIGRVEEPALGSAPVPLFDHLPGARLALDPGVEKRRARFRTLAEEAKALREAVDDTAWKAAMKAKRISLDEGVSDLLPRFVENKAPLRALAKLVKEAGERVVLMGSARDLRFLAPRVGRSLKASGEAVADWAAARAGDAPLSLLALPADRGWQEEGLIAVAAADLLGSRAVLDPDQPGPSGPLRDAQGEIGPGDVVVHEDHGLAQVIGLEPLADGGDAIILEHAEGARRLVPVAQGDRLWRYGAEAEAVTLDRLDGASWRKRRGVIDAAVAESAKALAELAAERLEREAPVLEADPAQYERFAAGFPFHETADQARAIEAVRTDLAAGRPMDRLVVGDVGYGKTEVALRAAAVAALAGHQVALAAPTTVLVRQHLESFKRRFARVGIEVAGLSRLSTPAERKAVKAGLADGSIRVVIGTGALAGKGVEYKNLALVVIDEEQRFGAADKAKLRDLGAGHVLSLSATPIPRTLQMALVGLQQVCVIATPPARRQPIRTAIGEWDETAVRTALLREKARGGQAFVVVPRINDMEPMAKRLRKLVPDLTVVEAHGKLPAAELDEAMVRFAEGDGDVLLATNIIEAGLDVPRANTMIVGHADRFGLAQLHQLRGRVGRGARRGQVLLFTEPGHAIADATARRLRTLQAFDRLGAGFAISARDLDLRGAGDLVGDAQAGHMKLIGVDLYQRLLEGALRQARGETVDRWTPELELGATGRLPETWIPEEEVRVGLYVRLARIEAEDALDAFESELADRFGPLPDEAATLIAATRIRLLARASEVARIDAGPGAIALTMRGKAEPGIEGLTEKNGRWLLAERIEEPAARMERVRTLLEEIGA
ncbi:helicase-related protein [Sphingomonas jatrophae]|nr:helicase-related protein [Sphingomonas jatrophae]